MSFHDSSGSYPAHDSDRPPGGKAPMMNVDKTGVSMSWKTAWTILATVVFGMLAWNTFSSTLARSSDLVRHDIDKHAHENVLQGVVRRSEVDQMIAPLQRQVDHTEKAVNAVQASLYEQRAEDLAWRAVEKLPARTPTRDRIERFERVKSIAKTNLMQGRDIRDGIDAPLL